MVRVSLIVGLFLVALGLGVFAFHPEHPYTSLIPAGFGVLLILLGYIARNPAWRKHAMHAAAALALVGAVPGVMDLIKVVTGAPIARPDAAIARSIMAGACIVFVILAVRSFVNARRSPQPTM